MSKTKISIVFFTRPILKEIPVAQRVWKSHIYDDPTAAEYWMSFFRNDKRYQFKGPLYINITKLEIIERSPNMACKKGSKKSGGKKKP